MRRHFAMSTILLLLFMIFFNCSWQIEPPPNAQDYASIVVEFDWMQGYDLEDFNYNKTQFSFDYVYDAFDDVGLTFHIIGDPVRIPPYSEYDPSYPYFPETNDRLLRNYAKAYDCDSLSWHLLSVNSSTTYKINGIFIAGRSTNLNSGPNVPPTPANERYSMIFTQDIIDYNSNNPSIIVPYLVTIVVHELGHQRAGLTDATAYSIYHDLNFNCVMHYFSPITLNPRFCKEITGANQVSSCKQNIEANYGNF